MLCSRLRVKVTANGLGGATSQGRRSEGLVPRHHRQAMMGPLMRSGTKSGRLWITVCRQEVITSHRVRRRALIPQQLGVAAWGVCKRC